VALDGNILHYKTAVAVRLCPQGGVKCLTGYFLQYILQNIPLAEHSHFLRFRYCIRTLSRGLGFISALDKCHGELLRLFEMSRHKK